MAAISFAKVYNFARLNPGMATAVLGVGWPLTIVLAAMLVLISPLLFPAAMIAAYVLKYADAPPMAEKKSGGSAGAAPAPRQLSARMEIYYEDYPEVAPSETSLGAYATTALRARASSQAFFREERAGFVTARHTNAGRGYTCLSVSPGGSAVGGGGGSK